MMVRRTFSRVTPPAGGTSFICSSTNLIVTFRTRGSYTAALTWPLSRPTSSRMELYA